MRYFFHLYNGAITRDEEGVELEGSADALRRAQREALEIAAECVREGYLDLRHYVEVTDGLGNPLFRVTFGEVVDVTGR